MPRKSAKKQGKTKKISTKKEFQQTHGKVENTQPTTLDQIWGDEGSSKYQTLDVEEYRTQLREMNRTDIQAHATKLGVVPVTSREMLEKRLVKEFEKHVASYRKPNAVKPDENVSEETLKILSEGR